MIKKNVVSLYVHAKITGPITMKLSVGTYLIIGTLLSGAQHWVPTFFLKKYTAGHFCDVFLLVMLYS